MKKLSCLIVDDDIEFANMVAASIRTWGYDTVVCHNWLTVMVKLKKHAIDMIIADIETPTGNGLSVMGFLSSDPLVAETKKVFLSGLNDESTQKRVRDMNAKYIHKSSTAMRDLKQLCDECSESIEQEVATA